MSIGYRQYDWTLELDNFTDLQGFETMICLRAVKEKMRFHETANKYVDESLEDMANLGRGYKI